MRAHLGRDVEAQEAAARLLERLIPPLEYPRGSVGVSPHQSSCGTAVDHHRDHLHPHEIAALPFRPQGLGGCNSRPSRSSAAWDCCSRSSRPCSTAWISRLFDGLRLQDAVDLARSRPSRRRSRRSRLRFARSASGGSDGMGASTVTEGAVSIGWSTLVRASINSSTVRPFSVIFQPPLSRSTSPWEKIRGQVRAQPAAWSGRSTPGRWSPRSPCHA